MEEKNTLVTQNVCFQRPQNLILRSQNQICGQKITSFPKTITSEGAVSHSQICGQKITSFLKTITLEGAVSHNVLHYQQLSIACYQVSFCANNYFE